MPVLVTSRKTKKLMSCSRRNPLRDDVSRAKHTALGVGASVSTIPNETLTCIAPNARFAKQIGCKCQSRLTLLQSLS